MIKLGLLEDNQAHIALVEQALLNEAEWGEPVHLETFTTTLDLLFRLKQETFDCVILDRNLPDISGDLVVQWLTDNVPGITSILMLTSVEGDEEVVKLLSKGANEYLTKPFHPKELFIRTKRLVELARLKHQDSDSWEESFEIRGVQFDNLNQTVQLKDQLVHLTEREYRLTKFLFKNVGVNLSRSDILNALNMQQVANAERSLTAHIHNVRDKLELTVDKGWCIRPIYGFGYRLDAVSA